MEKPIEFTKRLTNAEELLRQVEGETTEDAIKKWWALNGLDPIAAREQRKERYLQQLKDAAKVMDRFYSKEME